MEDQKGEMIGVRGPECSHGRIVCKQDGLVRKGKKKPHDTNAYWVFVVSLCH